MRFDKPFVAFFPSILHRLWQQSYAEECVEYILHSTSVGKRRAGVVIHVTHNASSCIHFHRMKVSARCVAKNWIYPINSSSHVNADIKCACGVGIAFGSPSRDCVRHVALPTAMTPTSLVPWMSLKCSRQIRKR